MYLTLLSISFRGLLYVYPVVLDTFLVTFLKVKHENKIEMWHVFTQLSMGRHKANYFFQLWDKIPSSAITLNATSFLR